jgi:hypothetical protein
VPPPWSPRRLGKPHRLPDGDGALPVHPLPTIIRAKHSEDQAWEEPGRTVSPARYPLSLASFLLAPDAGGTTGSIRWTQMSQEQLHYTRQGSPTTQVLDGFKNRVSGASIYSCSGTPYPESQLHRMERSSTSKGWKSSWGKHGGAPLRQAGTMDRAGLDVPRQKAGSWYCCGTLIARSDQGNPD